MNDEKGPRLQCNTRPWKRGADNSKIPGYSREMHKNLKNTIAEPGRFDTSSQIMACHYSKDAAPIACVGWMANQLGNNNIGLRLMVAYGEIDGNVRTVGPQKTSFEETLRRKR